MDLDLIDVALARSARLDSRVASETGIPRAEEGYVSCAAWCGACKIFVSGLAQWHSHVDGNKHRRNGGFRDDPYSPVGYTTERPVRNPNLDQMEPRAERPDGRPAPSPPVVPTTAAWNRAARRAFARRQEAIMTALAEGVDHPRDPEAELGPAERLHGVRLRVQRTFYDCVDERAGRGHAKTLCRAFSDPVDLLKAKRRIAGSIV